MASKKPHFETVLAILLVVAICLIYAKARNWI